MQWNETTIELDPLRSYSWQSLGVESGYYVQYMQMREDSIVVVPTNSRDVLRPKIFDISDLSHVTHAVLNVSRPESASFPKRKKKCAYVFFFCLD